MSIEKRIAALESAAPLDGNSVLSAIFLTPMGNDNWTSASAQNHSQEWTRIEGESTDDFRERIEQDVKRNEGRVALVLVTCA